MALDITKLQIGPANVYLYEGSSDVHIGSTGDNIEVQVKQTFQDLTAQQLGTAPANKVLSGVEVIVSFSFKEIILENFQRAIIASKSYVDDVTPTKRRLEIYPRVGLDLASIAKALTIKPIIGGVETTDKEKIIVFPKAAPDSDTIQFAYSNTGQREIQARFYAFPDTANNNRLMYLGDSTATDSTTPFGF